MKLYTVSWQNRPLVCLESQPGWLTPLPYETMNHLLMDAPDHRDQVLARAAKGRGEFSLGDVTVLAPIPHPRQDVICLGMNYRAHKAEAEQFDPAAFTRQGQAVYFSKRATACPGPGAPILATGTPAGVGMGFDPPKFLKAGDVVRCEIDGIGVLENPVE